MSRLVIAALLVFSASPAFAATASATMGVGVVVLPSNPPQQPAPATQTPPADQAP